MRLDRANSNLIEPSCNRKPETRAIDQSKIGKTNHTQFKLPGHLSQDLRKGQSIRFVGTIEKVGILETFPPMPNTYVFLKSVSLE